MNETYKVRSIGGSLLVAIPQKLARELSLKAGDEVVVSLTGLRKGISIYPARIKSKPQPKERER